MVTMRAYVGTYESFKRELGLLKRGLNAMGFTYEKEIVEFSIYDTKVSHDFKWLNKEEHVAGVH